MKTLIAALLALALIDGARAQTAFSFSGLQWGDTLETVDSKLKIAGFSGCSIAEKLTCKAIGKCMCTFSGSGVLNSRASFEGLALDSIAVAVADANAVLETLKRKYGTPLPKRDMGQGTGVFADIDFTVRWQSQYGETILVEGASVLYTSGSFYKRQEERKRLEGSKF